MEVYTYQGKAGESVPETVEKLIVAEGLQELPHSLCHSYDSLREIILSHQLQTIGEAAFALCESLQRIVFRSPITVVENYLFGGCYFLKEVNLSTTATTKIAQWAFCNCFSLQTVSLPKTMEQIEDSAFFGFSDLVTVVVQRDSKSINIGRRAFYGCSQLANVALPKHSTAKENSFAGCERLHELFGEDFSRIVVGLICRFDNLPMHSMCYCQSSGTDEKDFRQWITEKQKGASLVDGFGMTPLHILFSTVEPSVELLQLLLNSLPPQILFWKDANDNFPLYYLIRNWTDDTSSLVQMIFQKWAIDRLASRGTMSWAEKIQDSVQKLLAAEEEDLEEENLREDLYFQAQFEFWQFEKVESTAILELALWKHKLKSGWNDDGTKRQALDREECRCLSGTGIVVPRVTAFLN